MSDQNPYGQPFQNPPADPPPQGPPPQGPPPQGPPPQGYYPPVPRPPQPLSPSDERLWGMLAYLLAILVGFIAPLIIYLVYRERSAFVRATSREALNLQITAAIASLGLFVVFMFSGIIFSIALPPVGIVMFFIWMFAAIALAIVILIFEIIGAMKANAGIVYEVPYILRLVKN